MVEVNLIGYNGDVKAIEGDGVFSPETLSAGCARVSRDPRPLTELTDEAREEIEKARRSNRRIIFGYNHTSVSEHAAFTFAIKDISRLAIEELQARRIGEGCTEKSQRYIQLGRDFVTPPEFIPFHRMQLERLASLQNDFYEHALPILKEYQFDRHPEMVREAEETRAKGKPDRINTLLKTLEGWAKEDARYGLGLSTSTQVGVTFNGRTLEYTIRVLKHSPLQESRELASKLYSAASAVAPSLLSHADPEEFKATHGKPLEEDFFIYTEQNMRDLANSEEWQTPIDGGKVDIIGTRSDDRHGEITLYDADSVDRKVIEAILNSHGNPPDRLSIARARANRIIRQGRAQEFIISCLKHMSKHDSPPREFEAATLTYDIIASATNFAQMKRHRMMALLPSPYSPDLGVTIPQSITDTGLEPRLREVCGKSEEVEARLKDIYGKAASYALTNAHRRGLEVIVNPRELYHISRLREDAHAQWDIRQTASWMLELAKKAAPATFLLACGKDKFDNTRERLFSE